MGKKNTGWVVISGEKTLGDNFTVISSKVIFFNLL
jgi:hypothetical protein